ncbi:uncharacterized protein TRIVIDRAFT_65233 [Trichoderma virens Gv29-8]|uniref:Uncharacterized protein n=1 Tax=Hypocrea virens (strain Gv29-8 / FGSC 10586) TaxID=413071 RepID=G9NAT1_HYPVG|nr:uncharacterized protein TRIVIDRAFT_65233 [Trichoderma virens Gv29-8]EHK15942.1 hypothetical protein TRIVIDRAFT_65233 [Trichoderma virens Gv29-8]
MAASLFSFSSAPVTSQNGEALITCSHKRPYCISSLELLTFELIEALFRSSDGQNRLIFSAITHGTALAAFSPSFLHQYAWIPACFKLAAVGLQHCPEARSSNCSRSIKNSRSLLESSGWPVCSGDCHSGPSFNEQSRIQRARPGCGASDSSSPPESLHGFHPLAPSSRPAGPEVDGGYWASTTQPYIPSSKGNVCNPRAIRRRSRRERYAAEPCETLLQMAPSAVLLFEAEAIHVPYQKVTDHPRTCVSFSY